MKILVAYASRHGATKGIAERIARTLERTGLDVTLAPADRAGDPQAYDAVVVGSAAYNGRWLKEATQFVRRNQEFLAGRSLWLFSSGPIGTDLIDAKGRDVVKASVPRDFAEFGALHPRDERVFFGAYDPDAPATGLAERAMGAFMRVMPSIRTQIPSGDFRDWPAIEAWADGIARALQPVEGSPALAST
jgi:menaquinone-dependent protoporphyrinogen oxidase